MDSVTIRHSITTPERYQPLFKGKKLKDYVEAHSMFALPGPTTPELNIETEGTAVNGKRRVSAREFQVLVDVTQFRPEDILIQIFEGWLVVKAQHGPRMDEHGFVSRRFSRQYKLPEHLQVRDLRALLCHDGILVVETKDCALPSH